MQKRKFPSLAVGRWRWAAALAAVVILTLLYLLVRPHFGAGDGKNLLASEALDGAFGSSPVASVTAIGPANAVMQEYKIAAEGGSSEHFAALSLPTLAPGRYTLSMQVRPEGAQLLALQLKDGANNGALVDYLPAGQKVWINRIGAGGKLNATVRPIEGGWFQLTLTASLSTETGSHLFIHLKDQSNNGLFTPHGEAITVRAVKLEPGEVATAYVPNAGKMPGDGHNVLPPEALAEIGSSPIASVVATDGGNASMREFMIAAEGGLAEHYAALGLPSLAPGPYTLSMQVRPKVAQFLALQLKDAANNGVLVDYLPSDGKVWINRIGAADGLSATVRRLDDGWFQLTLTTGLSTPTGNYLFIHLKEGENNGLFLPHGEAITIRAVKLERGETATPYRAAGASDRGN